MFQAVNSILDAEIEAKEIIKEAKAQAERIILATKRKLEYIYREAYKKAIVEAEHRAKELIKEEKEKADFKARNLPLQKKKQIEDIKEHAKQNFDKAVDFVLKELTA